MLKNAVPIICVWIHFADSSNNRLNRVTKIAVFLVMADVTCRMSIDSRSIILPPLFGVDPITMNSTLLKLYIMLFYGYLYSPLMFSLPRYDLFGFRVENGYPSFDQNQNGIFYKNVCQIFSSAWLYFWSDVYLGISYVYDLTGCRLYKEC